MSFKSFKKPYPCYICNNEVRVKKLGEKQFELSCDNHLVIIHDNRLGRKVIKGVSYNQAVS